MNFILLLPFGSALTARLRYHHWQGTWPVWIGWAVWLAASLIAFVALCIANASYPFWLVLAASAVGFLGPELWASCRGFMSHPRVFGWIAAVALAVFVLTHQGILGGLLLIGIIILGYRIMLRPLFRRR